MTDGYVFQATDMAYGAVCLPPPKHPRQAEGQVWLLDHATYHDRGVTLVWKTQVQVEPALAESLAQ